MERIPPEVLLSAYIEGVFPMSENGEIFWFSPKMRGIIPLDDRFHINKGLKRALKKRPFEIRYDTAFREVMEGCSEREETWIDPVIKESYCDLFERGFAHSVECWDEDGLQGGLYGVRIDRAFFGESMFSRRFSNDPSSTGYPTKLPLRPEANPPSAPRRSYWRSFFG